VKPQDIDDLDDRRRYPRRPEPSGDGPGVFPAQPTVSQPAPQQGVVSPPAFSDEQLSLLSKEDPGFLIGRASSMGVQPGDASQGVPTDFSAISQPSPNSMPSWMQVARGMFQNMHPAQVPPAAGAVNMGAPPNEGPTPYNYDKLRGRLGYGRRNEGYGGL